ncbi:hypothetical protein BN6_70530 [Saccharothrix espanaensis DSM 44229]|uniref:NB-ARC domain-containing protein n=1 Tax=Saccharothrix espanaensis (strain ATCC 51144 / DSM 44229 / JCM 9112 / NBRC 15066 / NRRL 15764) TaxID=1179773 RepID=K0KCF4_SACES|nr:hypothetical protein BN6_70530 [Saccharothrix espanaensis DSM 44229]
MAGLPPVDVFTGRAEALAGLADALRPKDDAVPVVLSAVAGLAGVGKMTLAVRAAHDAVAAGWFPGGVLFVDLQGYDPQHRVTPEIALSVFLRALGVPAEHVPDGLAGREALYRSLLAERAPVLVVLDNASAAGQVRPLLPNSAAHRVLVTSRHTLADLTGARLIDLTVLEDAEAVALVDAAVRAARPDDDRITPGSAAELVALCGNLPLALSIVAAILAGDPEQPVAELVEALRGASTRLGELAYGDSVGMHAAFDLSYHRLTPAEARLFRLLALNPGRQVGVPAAALAGVPEREATKLLTALRRAHMVEAGEPRGWFRSHDLLRLYAEERAREDADAEDALVRLLDHYATTVESHDPRGTPTGQFGREALTWFETEQPTLVEAVGTAHRVGRPDLALRLALAMSAYLFYRRLWDDCTRVFPVALEAARRLGGSPAGSPGGAFGERVGGPLDGSRGERVGERLGGRVGEARVLRRLGRVAREQRRFGDARAYYLEYLEVGRELGDRARVAQAVHNLGSIARLVRELAEAEERYGEALALYRELGDRRGETDILFNLGTVARDRRRYADAHERYGEAMALAVQHGDVLRQARVALCRGIVAAREQDAGAARTWWTRALGQYLELGDENMVRSVRKRLARQRLREVVAGLPAVGEFVGRGEVLREVADALWSGEAGAGVVVTGVVTTRVVVTGEAGVGKTALAVRAARDAAAAGWFPGGVLFVELRGDDPDRRVSPEVALGELLRALGVSAKRIPDGLAERVALYRSLLAGRARVLVVLDGASADAGQVEPLLPLVGAHRVLITSRHAGEAFGGAAFGGARAGGVRRFGLGVMDGGEALELVDGVLSRSGAPAGAGNRVRGELVELCGRLPLALSVAAGAVGAEAAGAEAGEEVAGLVEALRGVAGGAAGGILKVAYERLGVGAARMLRLLSVHPGGPIGVAAAAALVGESEARAAELLAVLRRTRLVEEVGGWFRWHDLVRVYAEGLVEGTEGGEALARLVDHYVAALDVETLDEALEVELPAVVAAAERADGAGRGDRRGCLRLTGRLAGHLVRRRRWDDCAVLFPLALEAARLLGDRAAEVQVLADLGNVALGKRQFEVARGYYEEALARCRESGDWRGEVDGMCHLGAVDRAEGRYPEARGRYAAALRVVEGRGDPMREGRIAERLGFIARHDREVDAARRWFTRAVGLYEKADRHEKARAARRRVDRLRE